MKLWNKVVKRGLCVALMGTLLVGAVSACGNDDQISVNKVKYEYAQELNVVEDNYRNYYEIFVGSFYDSDGDGKGDLKGVTEKLDYIKDMGFNGIWLMPIMKSATYHKYDVVDYMEIDPEYGSIEDFEALVEECHKRDIRIIIDFVMNHTSSKHEWFTEACKYLKTLDKSEEMDAKACKYVDYYHFTTEKKNETYYSVPGTKYYYEGSFWSEMPDLNFKCQDLKDDFEDIIDFWLAEGIDGFRMDATMHFEEGATEFNCQVMNWVYEYGKSKNPDFYMVSEVWSNFSVIAEYYDSMTPSMFNFEASGPEGIIELSARDLETATKLVKYMAAFQDKYGEHNPDFIDAPFLTNHDNIRVANNLVNNEEHMKMAAGILLTMNGSPFVYYGEEIGMKSTGTKDEDKRMPMDWFADDAKDTTGLTDAPNGADLGETNQFASVEEQLKDGHSILNYYKRALRLRNENPELARGEIALVEALLNDKTAAITKTYEGSTIGVVYNTGDEEAVLDLKGTELESMGIRGYLTLNGEEVTLTDGSLSLPGKSICILK